MKLNEADNSTHDAGKWQEVVLVECLCSMSQPQTMTSFPLLFGFSHILSTPGLQDPG